MEAAPRLSMICFPFKTSTDKVSFGPKLKQYIANFYHEDPESYNNEIYKIESLRAAAVHPSEDVSSCQLLKEYYCQLHFLKSRFPMEEGQACAIYFSWKDNYTGLGCSVPDINFELMCILYNIGALHTQLGSADKRISADGMKMSCTHFQCAAWAFQTIKETYSQMSSLHEANEIIHAMHLICLAQAQECILEKSMLDNRKATIIAKVAVQVVHYYKQALSSMQTAREDTDILRNEKQTLKYLTFKCEYYRCIALLYQGQQAEEQQKMGERVAFYQAALHHHEEARKHVSGLSSSMTAPFKEALTFTLDVVEGKRKAAKNENEFIYHEEVPDKDALVEIKGASLVKGIPFSVNDVEVSGPDIFSRLVPMEAHEASSLYSEQKADMLRRLGQLVETKDQALEEFMSSLHLDVLSQMHQARGLPQELVDRAAALSAKPAACQDLINVMGKLSNSFHDVEAMLQDIQSLLKEEEQKEKDYQSVMGKRPPSIIATDLAREAAKYLEAHGKASESNQNLHRAMTAHVANIKLLAKPLVQLQTQIPSIEFPNPNIDEKMLKEVELLMGKVDEMKTQRVMLWAQLHDAMHQDDITGILITRQQHQTLEQVFKQELEKHQQVANLIEQNVAAQENILKALVDTYAQFANSRKYLQDTINKRSTMITNLISSYDMYDDLLGKANKGIEFYSKLETNVSKLLQRIKSACKVQDEEREQILLKNKPTKPEIPIVSRTPKLKDYLDSMKGDKFTGLSVDKISFQSPVYQPVMSDVSHWPPGIRPAPVGSEVTSAITGTTNDNVENPINYGSGYVSYGSYGGSGQGFNASDVYTYSDGYNHPISNTGHDQKNQPSGYGGHIQSTSESVYGHETGYSQNNYSTIHPQTDNPYLVGTTSSNINYNNVYAHKVNQPTGYVQQSGYNQQPTAQNQPISTSSYIQPTSYQQPYPQISQHSNQGFNQPANQIEYNQPDPNFMNQNVYVQPYNYSPPTTTQVTYTNNQSVYSQSIRQPSYIPSDQMRQLQSPVTANKSFGLSEFSNSNQSDYLHPLPPVNQSSFPQAASQISQFQSVETADKSFNQFGYSQAPNQPIYSEPSNIANQIGYHQPSNPTDQMQQPENRYTQSINQPGYAQSGQINQNQPDMNKDKSIDETLTERMAALMSSKRQAASSYIPMQYTQYGYGSQDYQLANSYSYATTLMPNASTYQTVSSTNYPYVTTSEQCTDGANSYNTTGTSNISHTYDYDGSASGYQAVTPMIHSGSTTQTTTSQYPKPGDPMNAQISPNLSAQQNYPYQQYYDSNAIGTMHPHSQYYSYQDQENLNTGNYGNYYYGYPTDATNYPNTTQTAIPISSSNQPQQQSDISRKKESSIDLLSGLEFNIPHTPLVPQQKSESNLEKKEVPVSKPIETAQFPNNKSTLKPEEKPQEAPITKIKAEQPRTDPFQNADVVKQFFQEVEKFEKFCDTLVTKTLNGPTNLDLKWKEIQDRQDNESYNRSISVARCYPLQNRFPDILPYDYTRVELKMTNDDYINASYVKDASPNCPIYILTQAPTPTTFFDFWTMIWEQDIEIIVCVLNNNELGSDIYWPKEIGKDLTMADKVISLVSTTTKDNWIERRMSISIPEKRKFKNILHLQFTSWPGSLFPTSPVAFVNFTKETLTKYDEQNLSQPILVHCSSGVGRSGLFCILLTAILEIMINPCTIPDIAFIGGKMSCKRKNILRDREHLKFAYIAFLYYLKELQNRFIKPEISTSGHSRKASTSSLNIPPEDPLSALDPLWATKRNN